MSFPQGKSECRCGRNLGKVASPTECQRKDGFDIREYLKVSVMTSRSGLGAAGMDLIDNRIICKPEWFWFRMGILIRSFKTFLKGTKFMKIHSTVLCYSYCIITDSNPPLD